MLRTILFLVAISALSGPVLQDNPQHSFKVYQEDNVTVAITSGGPKYTEPLFDYEVVVTLKENPDRPESILFRPGDICMDQEGNIYVEDKGNGRMAVFNPQGNFVRSFGKVGDGPGEFRSMYLLHLEGDVLSIHDTIHLRTTLFKTDGTLLEVISNTKKLSRFQRLHRTPDNRFVSELPRVPEVDGVELDNADGWRGRQVIVTNADDDTLAIVETPWVETYYRYSFDSGGGSSRMAYSGDAEAIYVPGSGILVSTGVIPEIEWYDLGGDLYKRLRFELNPEPVTSKEKGAIRRRMEESFERSQTRLPPGLASARRKALKFHEYKAFWDRVIIDDAGYLWLGIPEERDHLSSFSGHLYRVISPDGEYLGLSRLPTINGTVTQGLFIGYVIVEETLEAIPTVFRIVPIVADLDYP